MSHRNLLQKLLASSSALPRLSVASLKSVPSHVIATAFSETLSESCVCLLPPPSASSAASAAAELPSSLSLSPPPLPGTTQSTTTRPGGDVAVSVPSLDFSADEACFVLAAAASLLSTTAPQQQQQQQQQHKSLLAGNPWLLACVDIVAGAVLTAGPDASQAYRMQLGKALLFATELPVPSDDCNAATASAEKMWMSFGSQHLEKSKSLHHTVFAKLRRALLSLLSSVQDPTFITSVVGSGSSSSSARRGSSLADVLGRTAVRDALFSNASTMDLITVFELLCNSRFSGTDGDGGDSAVPVLPRDAVSVIVDGFRHRASQRPGDVLNFDQVVQAALLLSVSDGDGAASRRQQQLLTITQAQPEVPGGHVGVASEDLSALCTTVVNLYRSRVWVSPQSFEKMLLTKTTINTASSNVCPATAISICILAAYSNAVVVDGEHGIMMSQLADVVTAALDGASSDTRWSTPRVIGSDASSSSLPSSAPHFTPTTAIASLLGSPFINFTVQDSWITACRFCCDERTLVRLLSPQRAINILRSAAMQYSPAALPSLLCSWIVSESATASLPQLAIIAQHLQPTEMFGLGPRIGLLSQLVESGALEVLLRRFTAELDRTSQEIVHLNDKYRSVADNELSVATLVRHDIARHLTPLLDAVQDWLLVLRVCTLTCSSSSSCYINSDVVLHFCSAFTSCRSFLTEFQVAWTSPETQQQQQQQTQQGQHESNSDTTQHIASAGACIRAYLICLDIGLWMKAQQPGGATADDAFMDDMRRGLGAISTAEFMARPADQLHALCSALRFRNAGCLISVQVWRGEIESALLDDDGQEGLIAQQPRSDYLVYLAETVSSIMREVGVRTVEAVAESMFIRRSNAGSPRFPLHYLVRSSSRILAALTRYGEWNGRLISPIVALIEEHCSPVDDNHFFLDAIGAALGSTNNSGEPTTAPTESRRRCIGPLVTKCLRSMLDGDTVERYATDDVFTKLLRVAVQASTSAHKEQLELLMGRLEQLPMQRLLELNRATRFDIHLERPVRRLIVECSQRLGRGALPFGQALGANIGIFVPTQVSWNVPGAALAALIRTGDLFGGGASASSALSSSGPRPPQLDANLTASLLRKFDNDGSPVDRDVVEQFLRLLLVRAELASAGSGSGGPWRRILNAFGNVMHCHDGVPVDALVALYRRLAALDAPTTGGGQHQHNQHQQQQRPGKGGSGGPAAAAGKRKGTPPPVASGGGGGAALSSTTGRHHHDYSSSRRTFAAALLSSWAQMVRARVVTNELVLSPSSAGFPGQYQTAAAAAPTPSEVFSDPRHISPKSWLLDPADPTSRAVIERVTRTTVELVESFGWHLLGPRPAEDVSFAITNTLSTIALLFARPADMPPGLQLWVQRLSQAAVQRLQMEQQFRCRHMHLRASIDDSVRRAASFSSVEGGNECDDADDGGGAGESQFAVAWSAWLHDSDTVNAVLSRFHVRYLDDAAQHKRLAFAADWLRRGDANEKRINEFLQMM